MATGGVSAEARRKISESMKRRWREPAFRQGQVEAMRTREAMRKRVSDMAPSAAASAVSDASSDVASYQGRRAEPGGEELGGGVLPSTPSSHDATRPVERTKGGEVPSTCDLSTSSDILVTEILGIVEKDATGAADANTAAESTVATESTAAAAEAADASAPGGGEENHEMSHEEAALEQAALEGAARAGAGGSEEEVVGDPVMAWGDTIIDFGDEANGGEES